MISIIRLFVRLVYKKSLKEYVVDKSKGILKKWWKNLLIDVVLITITIILVFVIGIFTFNNLTTSVVHVTTNLFDEEEVEDGSGIKTPINKGGCDCGDCNVLLDNSLTYTTGNLTGNNFDVEVIKLIEALAKDTNSFIWMPYAKSAVECSGALTKPNSLYTNYSSIYSGTTDKLSAPDRWGSIGFIQITGDNAKKDTYSKTLTSNAERFKRAVQDASGDLSNYVKSGDPYANDIYEDRLYLPSQIGIVFYYYETVKKEYVKMAEEFVPGYKTMNANEQEVVLEMLYLASWNNGSGGTRKGLRNSNGGKLGQYIADLAKLFVDDTHFMELIKLDGVAYLGGNSYTKVVQGVLQYMGKNVSDYINSSEVNGEFNDWTSRTYCYVTNGILGGSHLFKKTLESTGGKVTGSLGKLNGGYSGGSGSVDITDIQLTYTADSIDGDLGKEYETVYNEMDYRVDLLEIGDDYMTGGSSDLPNRKLDKLDGIVIHYTGGGINGTADGVRKWFDEPYIKGKTGDSDKGTYTSSHYAIGADGEILQMAPLDNETVASNGANSHTISIEVNYTGVNGAYGSKAYNSLLHLVAWLAVEFNIDTDTNFIQSDRSVNGVLYRDMGNIQRHYDVDEFASHSSGKLQRAKACPLYWVPNDGSAHESGTTDGGNARWISFKKDLTSFIITYKGDVDFPPKVKVPGLDEAIKLSQSNPIPNWKSGKANKFNGSYECNCEIPCPKCDCHNGSDDEIEAYQGVLTGKASTTDYGYGTFKGNTWASSQFLDNAKTVLKAMINSGYDYSQSVYRKPIDSLHAFRYDCSGYVSAVLNYSGYTAFTTQNSSGLSADWDKYYTNWRKITDINELKPGDILIMNAGSNPSKWGTSDVGHVEIYAGDYKVYNVGSSGYATKYGRDTEPYGTKTSWDNNRSKRFIFAWRIGEPKN